LRETIRPDKNSTGCISAGIPLQFEAGGEEMPMQITVDHQQIAEFCRKHHIRKLAFFGSVLRNDFRPDSDVDVLVWFQPVHIPGLLRLMAMQHELTDLLGREVDLRTPDELSRLFRDEVVTEAEVQYAA